MAKKKRSLWEEMQDETLKRLAGYETTVNKRLQKYYKTEAQRLTDEIAAFYQKYGQNNIISYNNLMQALPPGDQDLLRQSINDFVAKYPQYARLAPVAENIYKLNRLEGLQASLRMHELNDGVFESQTIEKHLKQVGVDAYRETAQVTMAQYNPEIVKRFVNNLSTTNITDTVMNNKSKLARYLVEDISRGIARGDSYARLSKQIAERYQRVSRNDAARLIYTQGTLVHNEATAGVVENDFDQYQISTVGDAKVCEICRGFEGKIFEFKDRKVGENFPPFHPWCRCSFTIYVEDREQWLRDHTAGGGVSEAAEQELEAVEPEQTAKKYADVIASSFRFESTKEADEYFRGETYKAQLGGINKRRGYGVREDDTRPATKWYNSLTFNQTNAITDYTGEQYQPINNYLRDIWTKKEAEGQYYGHDTLTKEIKNIDAALKKSKLDKTITVYRTVEREFLDKLKVGGTFHDDGYGSTSIQPLPVASGDVHMEIVVQKGKGVGAYVDGLSYKEGEEFEFLLARGADYYVAEIDKRKDGTHIKAVVTGYSPKQI